MYLADPKLHVQDQAWAVLHLLAGMEFDLENYESVHARTAAWYNGRERGIVLSYATNGGSKTLNIAIFEHRNGDSICALRWESEWFGINPPTIGSDGKAAYPTENKHDVAHSVGWGKCGEMAQWVYKEAHNFLAPA